MEKKQKKLPYIPPQIKVVEFKCETWFPQMPVQTKWVKPIGTIRNATPPKDNAAETGFIDMGF